jgi:hypothetical protein
MTLATRQRNRIFKIVGERFEVEKFTFDVDTSTVRHIPTGAWLALDTTVDGRRSMTYTPGRLAQHQVVIHAPRFWPLQKRVLRAWLSNLQRETEPDLWASIGRSFGGMYGPRPAWDNSPFTPDEARVVRLEITAAKATVNDNQDLSAGQKDMILERLDYLSESVDRLGRLDWRNALLGALIELVLTEVVHARVVEGVLTALVGAIGHFFGGGPPSLPG